MTDDRIRLPSSRGSIDITNMQYNTRDRQGSKSHRINDNEKKDILKRYQEESDSTQYTVDFDLGDNDELDLSYSKFSHISGVSFQVSRGDPNSIRDSPFVKKIQSKVTDVEIERDDGRMSMSRRHSRGDDINSGRSSGNSKHGVYDENESPFIEKSREDGLNLQGEFYVKPNKKQYPLAMSKMRGGQGRPFSRRNEASKFSSSVRAESELISNESTHDVTNKHKRTSSVKVSLTPAQRVEKHAGIRSSNALENFQFSTLVGRGAFASVYKGINLKTNQVIAIKQISLNKNQDVRELMGEIDLLKILKHPNIVKYHGFVKSATSLNILLEYCSGGSLRQLYKELGHGLPEAQIVSYIRSVLQGLNYLHQQGVVHRDVKAANVLITEDEVIKLADFGVATKVSSQHETVVGTPNWMAPETVLGGEGLCTASDIWSLGATIIELFTTHPPYHDLNPMATLHAIGTDEHPPLPKSISPLAKDFLMECFQKQPNLRISAKMLLKHKWMTQSKKIKHRQHHIETTNEPVLLKRFYENDDNWEHDFEEANLSKVKSMGTTDNDKSDINGDFMPNTENILRGMEKKEILKKFSENNDDMEFDSSNTVSNIDKNNIKLNVKENELILEGESDPFLDLEIENFDTNELEIQGKMEFLVTKLANKIDYCHSGNEEVANSLVKITGRMLHLVKNYSISHDVLIRCHGILSLLELLDNASEFPKNFKLWYHTLSILNQIFASDIVQLENFCLLGGIPVITNFRSINYDMQIRLQVVKFIDKLNNSERALSIFISSGGLRILSKFVEEDFDTAPEFSIVAIGIIHGILTKDLTRSKSDLCRILSKYGIIFWLVVLLNRLSKLSIEKESSHQNKSQTITTIDNIISILKYFSQSEAKVRIKISNVDLFKLLIKVYSKLSFPHQLVLLKFFKSMSCIPGILKTLYSADILEFLIGIFETYTPDTERFKEVINTASPILYNCCYLNHSKEIEIVKYGAVPYLKVLSSINLPLRQFVLPILCELVHCNSYVRDILHKQEILNVYLKLLTDPYWHSNALDSILSWRQHKKEDVRLDSPFAIDCLVGGFLLSSVSNVESSLENYLNLINSYDSVAILLANKSIVDNLLLKLTSYTKNAVTQLTLLKVLKRLITIYKQKNTLHQIKEKVRSTLVSLSSIKNSVLVEELTLDILSTL